MEYISDRITGRQPRRLIQWAIIVLSGPIIGLAISVCVSYLLGAIPGRDDVAYALGGGIGCLISGFFLTLLSVNGPVQLRRMLFALLLGIGVAFSTLGFFWWLQGSIFVYRRYPDINYLLGEVAGYSGPGLGLLTCGIIMVLFCGFWQKNKEWFLAGEPRNQFLYIDSKPQRRTLELLLLFLLAAILGAGAGLMSGAMVYILLFGAKGSISDLAGFLAVGVGCLSTGSTFFLLCLKTGRLHWLCLMGVVLFFLSGTLLCSMGLYRWLN